MTTPSTWNDDPDFVPLLEYPDPESAYVSNELPAFFANRVLSAARPNCARYLDWLGVDALDDQDVPFEVLARTGGGRATDTFHVVDLPISDEDAFRAGSSSRESVTQIRLTRFCRRSTMVQSFSWSLKGTIRRIRVPSS